MKNTKSNFRRLLALLVALCLAAALIPATALAADTPFTDVPADAWYYNDVKNAYESGLIDGKSATSFAPNENITYAEVVKLAACMHQLYTTGSITLENGSPWYQSYADYAWAFGIISKNYDWNTQATRAEYMGIFASALPAAAFQHINTVFDGAVRDVPMDHPNAEAIYKLYRAGIVEGLDDARNCRPSEPIRRSEVAAILTRMMDSGERKSFTLLSVRPPLSGTWMAGTDYDEYGEPWYFGFLTFYQEGWADFSMGPDLGDVNYTFSGTYSIIMESDDQGEYPAGSIIFEMIIEYVNDNYWGAETLPDFVKCVYIIEMENPGQISLTHLSGDWLIGDWTYIIFTPYEKSQAVG